MTLFFILGIVGLFFFSKIPRERLYIFKWIQSLNKFNWFQNPWLVGVFLFGMNLLLFGATGLLLYGTTLLMIPYIHLIIMMLATVLSLLVWSSLVRTKVWGNGERWKAGTVGSSFYLVLFLFILYQWNTYVPQYPGEDGFMAFIGFFLGLVVTGMAFLICFMMIVFLPVDKRV